MDSLTRLAAAQRQIGLVAGEPPATRGYPPSVFALLPELLERAGRTADGSITGFYTVLVEGDDSADPVAEAVRAATDGHIRLSADLANRGHWPAIDVLRSVSRVMVDVADDGHRGAAGELLRLIALYEETADLLRVGAYKPGADAEVDRAVAAMPRIQSLLTQRTEERADFDETVRALKALHADLMQTREAASAA
jgi:flagellar biosynthesis/type III secretory pathway ATPase